MNTPTTLPAVRLPSYTRKLTLIPEAYITCMEFLALHATRAELKEMATFQATNPFPDGEPPLQDYWRAFIAWKKGRWQP